MKRCPKGVPARFHFFLNEFTAFTTDAAAVAVDAVAVSCCKRLISS